MKRLLKKGLIKGHRNLRKINYLTLDFRDKVYLHKDKAVHWTKANKNAVIILISIVLIIGVIHYFSWWEAIGILFLKFGLGAKITGAKTFARAVAKAGGTKVIAISTAGMLTKRHIIDISSKFFAKHSVEKYKANLISVIKIKIEDFKSSSIAKKIQAGFVVFLSIPGMYFFYTKFISVAIQKFVYALILPLFTLIWTLIKGSFNFIGLLFEVIALNVFLNAISEYTWGKFLIKKIDQIVYLIGDLFSLISKFIKWFFSLFGIKFNPKEYLVSKSLKFNSWLEKILDKGFNKIMKIERKRDRYINIVESISIKRELFSQARKDKKVSFLKTFKLEFKKRFFRKKSWTDMREERCIKRKERLQKTIDYRRKEFIKNKKQKRRNTLVLPYHDLVRYGEVEFRAKGKDTEKVSFLFLNFKNKI